MLFRNSVGGFCSWMTRRRCWDVLDRLLSRQHQVQAFGSADDVLRAFASDSYDVAVFDLGLPQIPGAELAQRLRQIDPLLVTVLITGWELAQDDPRRVGFDLYLQKPFNAAEIQAAIDRALEIRRSKPAP
jgi:CheY-like chemotaxis protein